MATMVVALVMLLVSVVFAYYVYYVSLLEPTGFTRLYSVWYICHDPQLLLFKRGHTRKQSKERGREERDVYSI